MFISGGIYSLLMIAGQDLRYVVAKMMKGNMPRDLANLLRAPDSGTFFSSCSAFVKSNVLLAEPAGRMVRETIIPALARLRQALPLTCPNLIDGGLRDCTDLTVTDEMLSVSNSKLVSISLSILVQH